MLTAAIAALVLAPIRLHEHCANHAFLPEYHAEAEPKQLDALRSGSEAVASNPEETHLTNVRQLTFGGQNAEAYWSKDSKHIVFQSLQPGFPDEQIFIMGANGESKKLVSTGKGRCTCSYFTPDNKYVYFSSTHRVNPGAQKKLDMSKGYLWMVNPQFSVYRVEAQSFLGDGRTRFEPPAYEPILTLPGYIAETTVSPDGKYLTFTSDFEGDLEIYRSDLKGKKIRRLTTDAGYDGGPFVSWDGKKIVYRRDTIDSEEELKDYKKLLGENLVRPSRLEIWIMDADGRNKRQITKLNCASFAPFLHPDNKRIIFASNYGDPKGREFDLFIVNVDGTGLERITKTGDFDGFPMFSRDGKKLLFASNRYGKARGETNVFVADWKD